MPTRSFPPPPVCAAAEAFRWEEEEEKFQVAKLPWPFLFPTMLDLGGRLAWAAFAAGRRRGRRWRWVFGFGFGVAARELRNLFPLLLHGLEEEEACNVCECGVDGVGGVCMRRVWPNCETAIPKLKGRRNRFESLLVTFF